MSSNKVRREVALPAVDEDDLATILWSLRQFQRSLVEYETQGFRLPDGWQDYCEEGQRILDSQEIDDLCEHLNCESTVFLRGGEADDQQ